MQIAMECVETSKNQFQKEQDDLLKVILNERYFEPWSLDHKYGDIDKRKTLFNETSLEIFITSTCNQSCEYCYLYNNPGIYPPEINNKELILKNLEILLNWVIDNNYHIPTIEFFSGEIWHSTYGLEVLEILYRALDRGLWVDNVMIPSNCSFVRDEVQLCKIQKYIDNYAKKGVRLIFSISVEGAILENKMRPLNSKEEKTDAFYERLFLFAKHNEYYFHPMVAAKSVKDWKENIDWWIEQCNDYDMDIWTVVMMLEVRNNDWTEENIQDYLTFLEYLIEIKLQQHNYNVDSFFADLLNIRGQGGGYIPFGLAQSDTFAGCTVANSLAVRLGDLAICPCHRTAYNKYLYGHFVVNDDNKIIDIVAQNPQMAIKILMANTKLCNFGCDVCKYEPFCLKGCYGSQYEQMGDPFVQIPGVCTFFRSKIGYLAHKYAEMGILDYIDNISPYASYYFHCQQIGSFIRRIINE